MTILNIQNLSKQYGRTQALNDLNLTVEKGNVYGLLGPNGSGKTTTLGIILGVTRATKGTYTWFEGHLKPHLARRRVGSLLETPNAYPYLSARENLKITANIRGCSSKDIERVLELVDLHRRANEPCYHYSLGMKQRLAIAATLLGNPDVLVFDEPTNGVDARGIVDIRNLILDIANQGKTIILASHILDEVERVCSHVAVLKSGTLLASGPIASVLSQSNNTIELASEDLMKLRTCLEADPEILGVQEAESLLLATVKTDLTPQALNRRLQHQGIVLSHLAWRKQSLEAKFLELTESP